jgi:hypothetical protein
VNYVPNRDYASVQYRTGQLPEIQSWVQKNLPAIRSAAGVKFESDKSAWTWITKNSPDGRLPIEWLTSLPKWTGGFASPSSGGVPNASGPNGQSSGSRSRGGSSGGGGGGGGTGGTSTSSQTQINLTDPYTARNLINQTLSQSLGRLATSAEMKQFTAALNAAERANPQTSFTSGSQDGAGNSTSSSVTGGGVDRNQVILDQVRTGAEYKAFNTDNVFRGAMDALAARIG